MLQQEHEPEQVAIGKTIIPRAEHTISRQDISENALKVLYRLHKSGYEAYLVGGGVRDLLLGKKPKDFDVTTNATPEEVKKLFRNCRLVGRRFRLAHILFGREIIEVATFRGHHHDNDDDDDDQKTHLQSEQGMLLRDNVYGTLDEDAERRDFTINALYYNIADFSIVDFAGGLDDIEQHQLRLIGDPEVRYHEDPVRMLRAIRFAVKLGFKLSDETRQPIAQLAHLLRDIPAARLFEECLKLFLAGEGKRTFLMLREYGLLYALFPQLKPLLSNDDHNQALDFICRSLDSTDQRVRQEQRVTPAFIFAAILWPVLEIRIQEVLTELSLSPNDASALAMNQILDVQCKSVAIPRRFTSAIREIWELQGRLAKRQGKRAKRSQEHPRFRAAFDFLELRAAATEDPQLTELATWWQSYQQANEKTRFEMTKELGSGRPRRARKPKSSTRPHRKAPRASNSTHSS
ncbi:polynucleotide adenylyltransferase PcnB [Celerinatantimonas sp. YJH-8]|uniref:polynucleotide adenylyltransferase PcnB n=1 Tax=Celerinatantimonas sp. YJH-8 TaxID=3228714 RepID=UPI0038C10071